MIDIKNYINLKKDIILKDECLKKMFCKNLSKQDVTIIKERLFSNSFTDHYNFGTIYKYAHHALDNNVRNPLKVLSLFCTANDTYIQYYEDIFNIKLKNNNIVYLIENNKVLLIRNRIVIATGTININSITWSDILYFKNNCYVKLPVPNKLYNDEYITKFIISKLVLNNLK